MALLRLEGTTFGIRGTATVLTKDLLNDMERAVLAAELLLERKVKEKLSGQRTGRRYRVPGTRAATYVASRPGEPPAVLFGHLRNSIGHTKPVRRGNTVSGAVGTSLSRDRGANRKALPYARRLEFGDPPGTPGRIAPRPYLRVVFEEQREAVRRLWARMLKR
jgi:hypothetical protein